MNKKIAVIQAYPAGLNAGMLSVDLSLNDILQPSINKIEVTRFCLEDEVIIHGFSEMLHYHHLTDRNQLNEFDNIIFWGDFPHWLGYAELDLSYRQKKRTNLNQESVMDSWYKLFLLENRIDLQSKSFIFGTTIYGLSPKNLSNTRYFNALQSLYKNSRLILQRDILSVNFANQMIGEDRSFLGCDCALLLNTSNWNIESPEKPYFVTSFGRSGSGILLETISILISKITGLERINIKWLDTGGIDALHKKVGLIKKAKFVLTDIYHLSLTAVREKVMVICFGNGNSRIENTLSEKKKEIFFLQSLLSSNYIFIDDVLKSYNSDLEVSRFSKQILNVISDEGLFLTALNLLDNQLNKTKVKIQSSLFINN